MNYAYILLSVLVMAVVTYLTRVVPLLIFKKPIKNRYIQSFLTYLPYGVLSAMIFPSIFTTTGNIISGALGTIVAMTLAFFKRGLVMVAIGAVATVFITEMIIQLI